MTAQFDPREFKTQIFYVGTSAERADVGSGSSPYDFQDGIRFFETDTGLQYICFNETWFEDNQVKVSGSVYGDYPNTLLTSSASASGAAAGTIATSNDVSMYNYHALEVVTLTATSVDPYASIDGTNYKAIRMYDANTGALFAASAITATGLYFIKEKYRNLRFDQVGAGATTIRYVHGWI